VFIAREQGKKPVGRDVRFYGVNLDEQSCRPLNSRTPMDGLLCSTKKSPQPSEEITSSSAAEALAFVEIAGARLQVSPASPLINDMIQFRLIGLNFKSIDVLYTINGERQPPAKNWNLDRRHSVRFPVTAVTPKGLYHFIGIRDSRARDSNRWIKVDTLVPIRLDGMP
jgi:hypothetical protein